MVEGGWEVMSKPKNLVREMMEAMGLGVDHVIRPAGHDFGPRGEAWEAWEPAGRRRIAVLEDQNELLLNARYANLDNVTTMGYFARKLNMAREAYAKLDEVNGVLEFQNNQFRRALEAARAKLVEQDSVIEKLVSGSGRKVMSC